MGAAAVERVDHRGWSHVRAATPAAFVADLIPLSARPSAPYSVAIVTAFVTSRSPDHLVIFAIVYQPEDQRTNLIQPDP